MDKYQCRRTNCEKEFDLQTNRTRHEKSCKNGELVKMLMINHSRAQMDGA